MIPTIGAQRRATELYRIRRGPQIHLLATIIRSARRRRGDAVRDGRAAADLPGRGFAWRTPSNGAPAPRGSPARALALRTPRFATAVDDVLDGAGPRGSVPAPRLDGNHGRVRTPRDPPPGSGFAAPPLGHLHGVTRAQDRFDRRLLQELLSAYGPCGQEDAVRDVCRRELEPYVDDAWIDEAGNLVGRLSGTDASNHPAVRLLAHLDELSMMVKRIDDDGTLHLSELGTMYPGNFGLGPVAILGDRETLCGVLAVGSEHTTKESSRIWQTKPDKGDRALDWLHVYVFTGLTPAELSSAGVHPGTRVCVDRSKRSLVEIADYLGCYFMDDRAAVTALLATARSLRDRGQRPPGDVYFVFTTNEEIGGVGGSYASRTLPGDLTLALEVGPTEPEYDTTVHGGPIVAYADAECVYDKDVADALLAVATRLGLDPQAAVLGAFESDASHAKASGVSPRSALLCLPTLATHGYEVIARNAIPDVTDVLVEFLLHSAWP